jgi:hypothetical protein
MESETPARAIREAVVTWRWSRDPGVRVRGACKARSSVACREKKLASILSVAFGGVSR